MNLLKQLFGIKPVSYYPILAHAFGDVRVAVLVQELAHWSAWAPDGWVYRTQEQIHLMTGLTRRQQDSCRQILRDRGILDEEHRGQNRLHYRVDFDNLQAVVQTHEMVQLVARYGATINAYYDTGNSLEVSNEVAANAEPHKSPTYVALIAKQLDNAGLPLDNAEKRNLGSYAKGLIDKKGATPEQLTRWALRYASRRADGARIQPSQAWADVQGPPDPKISFEENREARIGRRQEGYEWIFGQQNTDVMDQVKGLVLERFEAGGEEAVAIAVDAVKHRRRSWGGITDEQIEEVLRQVSEERGNE